MGVRANAPSDFSRVEFLARGGHEQAEYLSQDPAAREASKHPRDATTIVVYLTTIVAGKTARP